MELSKWLREKGVKKAWFARMIETDKANVTRWCNGDSIPESKFITKIARYTHGAVQANDWHPLVVVDEKVKLRLPEEDRE